MAYKLPFIQHNAIGIHITDMKVRWVELSRIGDRVRVVNHDSEKVNGEVEASLVNLVNRQIPRLPFVIVNIDSSMVIKKLMNAPVIEESELLDAWIEKQYSLLMEGRDNWDSYLIRHTFLGGGNEDETGAFFIAAVRKEAVERIEMLIRNTGLEPAIITTGFTEAAYGFLMTPEFIEGQTCVLRLFEDESYLARYHQGMLKSISPLDAKRMSVEDIRDELSLIIESERKSGKPAKTTQVYLIRSSEQPEFIGLTKSHSGKHSNIEFLAAEDCWKFAGQELRGDFSIAAGMAMKQLYRGLDDFNFLDNEIEDSVSEEIEKKDTLLLGRVAGALVLILFLVVKSIQFYANIQLTRAEEAAGLMQDKISAIEQAMEALTAERRRIHQVQGLIQGRSLLAPGLHKIGELTPANVWFSEMSVQALPDGNSATIRGFSLSDAGVSRFMENLETDTAIQNLALRSAERIDSDRIYPAGVYQSRPLVRFDLRVEYQNQ